jgi:hypothetical protein
MAQKELGQIYSDAMELFCEECKKMDFHKLSQLSSSDLSEDGSKLPLGLLLGHMPRGSHTAQNTESISKCWLCRQSHASKEGRSGVFALGCKCHVDPIVSCSGSAEPDLEISSSTVSMFPIHRR